MPLTPSALTAATDRSATLGGADAPEIDQSPERRLSVLIVAPSLDIGAADEGAVDLVRILAGDGRRVIVVSQGGRLEHEVARRGAALVKLNTTSRNPFVIVRNALRLRRIVREQGCDVVHAHGRACAWSAWFAARLSHAPFLTSCYTAFGDQNLFKHWYNAVMARGDRVIAASEEIAQVLVDRHRLAWDRICVIRTACDFASFDPASMTPERIAQIRSAWGVTNHTRVILVPGRIIRRKGHHVAVLAAARLKARGLRDFVFVFAGEDEGRSRYSGELWDLVLSTGAADVIRIAGPIADRAACYEAATMVVGASIQLEGLQRPMLEAMAMEKPVIASDLAAGPDTVLSPPAVPDERMTGLRVPAGDDAALAAALIRMLSYPEAERRAMGRRARAFVLAAFDQSSIAEQMLAVYARIAGVAAPPAAPPVDMSGGEAERR